MPLGRSNNLRRWSVVPYLPASPASLPLIILLLTAPTSTVLMTTGCASRTSVFNIVDYREADPARRYRETFPEAYYDVDGEDNVDIVFHRNEPDPANPAVLITQVIHLRTVWRSIPGKTVAERTQINATVSYSIVSGRIGAHFEGAGSVFIKENRAGDMLEGTLELALLKPKRRLGGGDIFALAELSGEFRAIRNRRRVVRIVNDTNRLFAGPAAREPVNVDPSNAGGAPRYSQ